jgi:hypothetical protein
MPQTPPVSQSNSRLSPLLTHKFPRRGFIYEMPEDRVKSADEAGGGLLIILYPTLSLIPDIRYTSPTRTRKEGQSQDNLRAGDHPHGTQKPCSHGEERPKHSS